MEQHAPVRKRGVLSLPSGAHLSASASSALLMRGTFGGDTRRERRKTKIQQEQEEHWEIKDDTVDETGESPLGALGLSHFLQQEIEVC